MMDYHVEMHRLLIYQAHILEHYNEENESHIKTNFKRQCSQKKKNLSLTNHKAEFLEQ